jgi:hypothetical protein
VALTLGAVSPMIEAATILVSVAGLSDASCMVLGWVELRPKASSTSAAQSRRAGSLWVVVVVSRSPASAFRSLVLSCFSTPISCSFSLLTASSWLSCCSITAFEFVVVVVVWVGTGVDGVVTWCASATRLSRSGVVVL